MVIRPRVYFFFFKKNLARTFDTTRCRFSNCFSIYVCLNDGYPITRTVGGRGEESRPFLKRSTRLSVKKRLTKAYSKRPQTSVTENRTEPGVPDDQSVNRSEEQAEGHQFGGVLAGESWTMRTALGTM